MNEETETLFHKELVTLLNCHSRENVSNTADFVLAYFLEGCLAAFDQAVQQRETMYGRDPRPTIPGTYFPWSPEGEADSHG